MTECDEIVIVMDTIAPKKTNTMPTNAMSTSSINYHSKKERDCYTFHSVISVHITIDNYYYLSSLCKTKRYNTKWKVMNFKKFLLKIVRVIISMT